MPNAPLRVTEHETITPQRGDEHRHIRGSGRWALRAAPPCCSLGILPHCRSRTIRGLAGPSESEELSRRGPAIHLSPTSTCLWHQALTRAGTDLARCNATETRSQTLGILRLAAFRPTSPHVFIAGRLLIKAPLIRPHLPSPGPLPRSPERPRSRPPGGAAFGD